MPFQIVLIEGKSLLRQSAERKKSMQTKFTLSQKIQPPEVCYLIKRVIRYFMLNTSRE
jgi:hypothetical protein